MDKPLWGLKVQAPFGARVLSFVCYAPNDGFGPQSGLVQRVVLYAAAWGSENRPIGLRPGGRRLAVRTAMEHPISALPRTPFPASRDFPSRGNKEFEKKNRESYTSCTTPAFPPLVAAPPPFPRKRGHYKAPLCCELLMKGLLFRALFCPLNRGKSGTAG